MIKKAVSFITTIIILMGSVSVSYASTKPEIISDTAILMDAATGQVIFEKNMHKIKEPASITKIPTVYLSIINSSPTDKITVEKSAGDLPYGVTHVSLLPGEQVTMLDIQHAAMLMSANDACNVIATVVSGTNQAFAVEMNEFAKSAGAINTNFTNPHGLPQENHVTTAYDMAMITRAAIQNADFVKLFSTVTYSMMENNLQPSRPFASQDESLKKNNPLYYQGIIGGKLGWTEEARHTKVTVAERNGKKLIAVVMDSQDPKSKYADTKALFDYGFSQFTNCVITPSSFTNVTLEVKDGINSAGHMDVYLPQGCEFLLHNSMSKKDVIIDYTLPESVKLSQVEKTDFFVTISVPQTESMYPCEIKLPLETRFTKALSTTDIIPRDVQFKWLGQELMRVSGTTTAIMFGIFAIIIAVLLLRKYIILFLRFLRKRKRAAEKREQSKKRAAQQRKEAKERATANSAIRGGRGTNENRPRNGNR